MSEGSLMTQKEAAEYLRVSTAFLAVDRKVGHNGKTIPYVKLGRRIFYSRNAVDAHLGGMMVTKCEDSSNE